MTSRKQPGIPAEQIPIEVQSVVKNFFDRFRDARKTDLRTLIEDIITFISIIAAYYCVSLSLKMETQIEEWTGIQFSKVDAEAGLLLIFALYLISLKILYYIAYKYDRTPPKKVLPPNWQEMEEYQNSTKVPVQNVQQKPLSPDAYSIMIHELLNYSIYGLIFMFCTTAYTFVSLFNKRNNFVEIQQINYLVLWFVAACIFYSLGKILGKMTKVRSLHHFGLTIGIMLIIIEIGLSYGFNMFLFI